MPNDDKKKNNKSTSPRLLDPTRSGEDFIGDTTGMTGITTGKAQETSRTPQDKAKDENKTHLPGGLLENEDTSVKPTPSKNDFSTARSDRLEDLAREPSKNAPSEPEEPIKLPPDNTEPREANTTDAPYRQPSNQGEQSVSGTTPDVESDDDTLANAHDVGEQVDEDEEHPKELDLGSDIDKAEENK